jgi:hypothetical protein
MSSPSEVAMERASVCLHGSRKYIIAAPKKHNDTLFKRYAEVARVVIQFLLKDIGSKKSKLINLMLQSANLPAS